MGPSPESSYHCACPSVQSPGSSGSRPTYLPGPTNPESTSSEPLAAARSSSYREPALARTRHRRDAQQFCSTTVVDPSLRPSRNLPPSQREENFRSLHIPGGRRCALHLAPLFVRRCNRNSAAGTRRNETSRLPSNRRPWGSLGLQPSAPCAGITHAHHT